MMIRLPLTNVVYRAPTDYPMIGIAFAEMQKAQPLGWAKVKES